MWKWISTYVFRRWICAAVGFTALLLVVLTVFENRIESIDSGSWTYQFAYFGSRDRQSRREPIKGYSDHEGHLAYNVHPDDLCLADKLGEGISHLPENMRVWKEGNRTECVELYARFLGIFDISVRSAKLVFPKPLEPRVKLWLGNNSMLYEEVKNQHVIHVYNKFTKEHTLYNPLRSKRPVQTDGRDPLDYINSLAAQTKETCDFCNYENNTATDSFGRIRGKYSVSAANIFKIDGYNGMFFPKTHNPVELTEEEFLDTFDTAKKWFAKVRELDSTLVYPTMVWDNLPHAGASLIHPHLHGFLNDARYLGGLEVMRLAAADYAAKTGGSYWDDFVAVHHTLGLTCRFGSAMVVVPLNAVKDHEVFILSSEADGNIFRLFFYVLKAYFENLKKVCFSVGVALPVLGMNDDKKAAGLPFVIRAGTRGDCSSVRSDVGALELYTAYNINTDPYVTIAAVREAVRKYAEKHREEHKHQGILE